MLQIVKIGSSAVSAKVKIILYWSFTLIENFPASFPFRDSKFKEFILNKSSFLEDHFR